MCKIKLINIKKKIKDSAYRERQQKIGDVLLKLNFKKDIKMLDVGCGDRIATYNYAKSLNIEKNNIYGIDIDDEKIQLASKIFTVLKVDIEKDKFPFEDQYFDLILVDQVYEHIKNIDHLTKEIKRLLKNDGILIISVPNLAAYYNRLLLLLGKQPLCINVFSEHVRGFCRSALENFILNKIPTVKNIKFCGAGFYPFYGLISKLFSTLFPSQAVYLIFVFKNNENS